ncbi:hypothetical protein DYB38_012186 [Aphanomyces astaci]|uniref:Reverse transcriptase domain-containing protein n=1 Tax=Aphanomyces astaci TaxID=112090 RepID=A0A397E0X0_APHAT|nr:hypothetical protein DYB38_012186 [Aphanomyces astaci]
MGVHWDTFSTTLQAFQTRLREAEAPPQLPPRRMDDPRLRLHTIDAYASQLAEIERYSFGEADILPLKKKGNSANALDYRPIALLNSAYKIFAQVISLRLQPLLVSTIGAQQQGFVPGRTLEDSIALFQRTLARQQRDPTLPLAASAAVICLDIKKAYDSMERAHLFCTMQAMGFPTTFVTLIERIHQDTSVQFVVNGIRSNRLPQTSGIRQG